MAKGGGQKQLPKIQSQWAPELLEKRIVLLSNICKVMCFINDSMESTKVLHF